MSNVRAAASSDGDCAITRAMCSRSRASRDTGAPTRTACVRLLGVERRRRRQAEIDGLQHIPRRQNHRALDGVAQFPKIARPGVPQHRLFGRLGEAQSGTALFLPEDREIVLREHRHVLETLSQRWQRETHHVEAVEQVLTKPAGTHFRLERTIGGGDEADIRPPLARFPEPLVGLVVEKAQQPRLRIGGQLADFVEEQRPAFGFLHLAATSAMAPVKAPRRWPKSALVIRSPDRAGQLTVTNGASARGLFARIQRASTFLPVPLSPRSRTTASDPAARPAVWRNRTNARLRDSNNAGSPLSSSSSWSSASLRRRR